MTVQMSAQAVEASARMAWDTAGAIAPSRIASETNQDISAGKVRRAGMVTAF